jgi:hypothetical protein
MKADPVPRYPATIHLPLALRTIIFSILHNMVQLLIFFLVSPLTIHEEAAEDEAARP